MKIIFLDIDGVLNCEKAYLTGFCKYTDDLYGMRGHQAFYPSSKDLINKLIEETGVKIVISSTWRMSGLEWMQHIWEQEEMSGEIIDITARSDLRIRGLEIDDWLNSKDFSEINWSKELQQEYVDKSGIENYLIIDDDTDMLYNQRNNFVHVQPSPRNRSGFNKRHYNKALRILSKTIIELKYG